ncbi:MAG: type II secretion system protein N [Desulfurivibrionaceae bacterium]
MKKRRSWIILTLGFYLLILFWTVPADYLLSYLRKHEVIPAGSFTVVGLEGPWTGGRIFEINAGGVEVNNLHWRFQPFGLLSGRLRFAVAGDLGGGSTEGVVLVGFDTVEIAKVRGRVPADFLGRIYLPGIELTGMLETEELTLVAEEGYLVEGAGRLAWSDARVESPYRIGLGGVVVDLATDDSDGIVFKLGDTGGALQAGGLGTLSPDGTYSFDGSLGARQGSSPELATYLQILGRPEADGMVKIGFNGQLPRLF